MADPMSRAHLPLRAGVAVKATHYRVQQQKQLVFCEDLHAVSCSQLPHHNMQFLITDKRGEKVPSKKSGGCQDWTHLEPYGIMETRRWGFQDAMSCLIQASMPACFLEPSLLFGGGRCNMCRRTRTVPSVLSGELIKYPHL